jgi:hypothetical protein
VKDCARELQKPVVQSRLEECLAKERPDHSCKVLTIVTGSCTKVETLVECTTLASKLDKEVAAKCTTNAISPEVFKDRAASGRADAGTSGKRSGSSQNEQFIVTSESESSSSSLSTGALIGIIVGSVCGAILIVGILIVAFFVMKGDGHESV